ncbi:hypothetical protein [Oceanobacillus jeddahense]|uniref:Uncharacterized protein n=1 Tax=Oceanobacillus jeddahense TaxID=1462527 RepID=A0ABY5JVS6_9BACI|nr:hypothetical protein [Oceanobacillus jeddahense]UUI04488.1 hypothetical protein NP439_07490 [Oceanobacillus jeddahense]
MKKVITGITPVLLLVLALTFMTNYKQWDDLSDTERYQIQNYVEAAEAADSESVDAQEEEQAESDVASANSDDNDEDQDDDEQDEEQDEDYNKDTSEVEE